MDVLYPLVLFALVGGIAIWLCVRALPVQERSWVARWVAVAFALRLAAATAFAAIPQTRLFHEDAAGYEWVGMRLARAWQGQGPPLHLLDELSQNYGFPYLAGAIYYVFGQFAPLVAYFNCVIGAITVFMVYRLARQLFHPIVARRAALLTAVVPSMILWSSIAIKDAVMAFLILLGLSSCVSLKTRFSLPAVLGIGLSLVLIQPIRFYMLYFLGFAILASLLIERGAGLVSGVYKQVIIGGVFVGLLVMVGFAGRAQEGLETLSLARVSDFRHGMAISANSGFNADADVSTTGGALLFLPIGIANLLLGPFPWQFGSLRALMAGPETIYWWLLFPSVLRAMWWMFRKRFADTSPLLLFAITLTAAYALAQGNVGSGFRQRAQIFIVLFIFAGLGEYRRRCERAGLDPDLLLERRDSSERPLATRVVPT